ncbi:MAG: BtrH N-terminal domain-containing protein, partial [Actinomycetes bacterium]
MTSRKQLKARIRARMATTGERYATARAHLIGNGADPLHIDHGWSLRGGTDPDAAGLAALLAHHNVTGPDGPLTEALLFGIGGGLGAGYILWEFKHDSSRAVVLGFANQWQYFSRRTERTLDRLGVHARWHRTGGARGAATRLTAELDAGHPAMVWPDRYHLGYWGLPAFLDGHGGHPVIVYAEENGRAHLDDRNLAPLTVARDDLDRARARVGSYRNALLVIDDARPVTAEQLRQAVRAGLRDVTEH